MEINDKLISKFDNRESGGVFDMRLFVWYG